MSSIHSPRVSRSLFLVAAFLALPIVASAQKVVGWGDNSNGAVTIPRGLTDVTQVAAGGGHSMALKTDGTVVAWGGQNRGQATVPAGLLGVRQIAAGFVHSLALEATGRVVGWGNDTFGESTIPPDLSEVVQMAGGTYFSLALKSDGTIVGWGINDLGQITIPAGLSDVVQIAAGHAHSIALKRDGTVVSWGDRWNNIAAVPPGLSGVVQVAAGLTHFLAVKSDGTVVGWGRDTKGEARIPAGLSDVVQVTAGQYHSLALKSDGTVVGWGYNGNGERRIPSGLTGVLQVEAGGSHSLALVAAAHCVLDQKEVTSGGSATGTVKIATRAPLGGTVVPLSSDDPSVHVPASVTIPEGATSATFPVSTDAFLAQERMVKIQTSYHDTPTVPFKLRVKARPVTLSLSHGSLVGGSTSEPSITLTLPEASAIDIRFSLASSDPSVAIPAAVTLPAGHTSARVPLTHQTVITARDVVLAASYGEIEIASLSLPVKPFTARLIFDSDLLEGGTSTTVVLRLNATLAHPLTIALSSSNPAQLSIPDSVRMAKGDKEVRFPVDTSYVDRPTAVVLTADINGNPFSARLKLFPGPTLTALSLRTYGYGHQTMTGTVKLREPAPVGGASVALSFTGPISGPASIVVPEGASKIDFSMTTEDVEDRTSASVAATVGAVKIVKSTSIRPLVLSALSLSASVATGGTQSTGTVTLNAAVQVDTVVRLSSDSPELVSVPTTVVIQAGSKSATFPIATTATAASKNVKISALKNGTSLYRTLKVTP
ncbi:hypothetical protein EON79_04335 [bacterium]|nr:MAG: hypothetical protein EON79_04335 [bacterium]